MKMYAVILALATAGPAVAADAWPQFLGPNGRAVGSGGSLPEKFGPDENVLWKADLPGRGLSCPVVADGKLFLTASSGMDDTRLHALAFDPTTGKKLWERQFQSSGSTQCHPKTCMACPTPVTDGKNVYCVFATGDVAALTADGDLKWFRAFASEYPKMANFVGRSSSPILAGGTLAVLFENQGDSFLFGLDPATGATRWRADRPPFNNWSTPLAFERAGGWDVVVQAADGMTAYDAATGQTRWAFSDEKLNQVVSPIAYERKIYSTGRGLFAIAPGASGTELAWKSKDLWSDTPTPVAVDGKVYALARNVLKCGDLTNGKQLWDLRVNGPFSASPVFADGKLYLTAESGKVTVVKPGPEPKIVSVNDLKDTFLATPAVVGGKLYFRSDKRLWCVAGGGKTS